MVQRSVYSHETSAQGTSAFHTSYQRSLNEPGIHIIPAAGHGLGVQFQWLSLTRIRTFLHSGPPGRLEIWTRKSKLSYIYWITRLGVITTNQNIQKPAWRRRKIIRFKENQDSECSNIILLETGFLSSWLDNCGRVNGVFFASTHKRCIKSVLLEIPTEFGVFFSHRIRGEWADKEEHHESG